MKHNILAPALGVLALSFAAATNAASVDINVDGIESINGIDDPANTVLSVDLGAGSVVTGLSWDVTITPIGASWYSEADLLFTDSAGGQGIIIGVSGDGFADDGVPLPYTGSVSFADAALPDIVLADGILLIEFFESFNDVPDAVDSIWGGTLTVEFTPAPVPVPGALLLLFSGLASAGFLRRKS